MIYTTHTYTYYIHVLYTYRYVSAITKKNSETSVPIPSPIPSPKNVKERVELMSKMQETRKRLQVGETPLTGWDLMGFKLRTC